MGDNIKHMLKVVNMWDTRHNMSHKIIKQRIREKNVSLNGRSIRMMHTFVDPRGKRVKLDGS